jgi:nicotinamidase/pyrazinamidase
MKTFLWEVDTQVDFMVPGGKLYVPGAEKIIPNVNRLVEEARKGQALLISSADAHKLDDPEFREWPLHCVKGTPGAELIPEARAASQLVVPNRQDFVFPDDFSVYRQLILEKNSLDVFDNPNTDALLTGLSASQKRSPDGAAQFFVFGVVTEHCVRCAADGLLRRGYRVSLVEDAIQSLDEKKGREILSELQSRGAALVTTEQALAMVARNGERTVKRKQQRAAGS